PRSGPSARPRTPRPPPPAPSGEFRPPRAASDGRRPAAPRPAAANGSSVPAVPGAGFLASAGHFLLANARFLLRVRRHDLLHERVPDDVRRVEIDERDPGYAAQHARRLL